MKLILLVPVALIAAAFIAEAVGNTCYPGLPMWHSCVGTTALDEGTAYNGTWEWNVVGHLRAALDDIEALSEELADTPMIEAAE
jgi:hypothetical protein